MVHLYYGILLNNKMNELLTHEATWVISKAHMPIDLLKLTHIKRVNFSVCKLYFNRLAFIFLSLEYFLN